MEQLEPMEYLKVETVNSLVIEKSRHIGRPTTLIRPPARTQTKTNLPRLNSHRIEPDRRKPIAREPIDMYTDEAIRGNDYYFEYESVQFSSSLGSNHPSEYKQKFDPNSGIF